MITNGRSRADRRAASRAARCRSTQRCARARRADRRRRRRGGQRAFRSSSRCARRVDADVAGEQRVLELVERLVVELAAARRRRSARPASLSRDSPSPAFSRSVHERASAADGRRVRGFAGGVGFGGGVGLALEEIEHRGRGRGRAMDTPAKAGILRGRPCRRPLVPLRPPNAFASSAARCRGRVDPLSARPPALRPTPDRVRETLFNWLGQDLDRPRDARPVRGQRRADARGAVARRGARRRGRPRPRRWSRRSRANARDASAPPASRRTPPTRGRSSRARRARFDVIFLDPPFADDPWAWLLPACAARLAPGGFVYAEAAARARAARAARGRTGTRGRGRCIIICCAADARTLAMLTVVYPGTFDPFTRGHEDLVRRAARAVRPRRRRAWPTARRSGRSSPRPSASRWRARCSRRSRNVEVTGFSSLLHGVRARSRARRSSCAGCARCPTSSTSSRWPE